MKFGVIHSIFEPVRLQEEMTSAAYGPELLAAYSAFERKLQSVKEVKEGREGTTAVRRLARSSDEVNIPAIL